MSKQDGFSRYEIRSSKEKEEFRLVVFKINLPEEGERGPLARVISLAEKQVTVTFATLAPALQVQVSIPEAKRSGTR